MAVGAYAVAVFQRASLGVAGVEATRNCYPDPNTLFGFEASVKQQTAFLKQHPEQFALAYEELTAGCNSCHTALNQGFIVIKTPDASAFPNQEFKTP